MKEIKVFSSQFVKNSEILAAAALHGTVFAVSQVDFPACVIEELLDDTEYVVWRASSKAQWRINIANDVIANGYTVEVCKYLYVIAVANDWNKLY